MGRDFAFLGRQVRITVGNKDYYIDLLFYHRKLRRLVLIELKLGEFLPKHKVKLFRWSFTLHLNLVELIQERAAVISHLKKWECYGC